MIVKAERGHETHDRFNEVALYVAADTVIKECGHTGPSEINSCFDKWKKFVMVKNSSLLRLIKSPPLPECLRTSHRNLVNMTISFIRENIIIIRCRI